MIDAEDIEQEIMTRLLGAGFRTVTRSPLDGTVSGPMAQLVVGEGQETAWNGFHKPLPWSLRYTVRVLLAGDGSKPEQLYTQFNVWAKRAADAIEAGGYTLGGRVQSCRVTSSQKGVIEDNENQGVYELGVNILTKT